MFGARNNLVEPLQRCELGSNGGIGGSMQNMRKLLIPRQRLAILNISPNEANSLAGGQLWISSLKPLRITANHANGAVISHPGCKKETKQSTAEKASTSR
jgi:hypothetical protein